MTDELKPTEPQTLKDEDIKAESGLGRRSFLTAAGALLVGAAALRAVAQTHSTQKQRTDPDQKKKRTDPDQKKRTDPDQKKKRTDPDQKKKRTDPDQKKKKKTSKPDPDPYTYR